MTDRQLFVAAALVCACVTSLFVATAGPDNFPPAGFPWSFYAVPSAAAWSLIGGLLVTVVVASCRPGATPPVQPHDAGGREMPRAGWVRGGVVWAAAFLAFALLPDQSGSGDYARILFDISHDVVLLKSEPLTPAFFLLCARAAAALGIRLVPALQLAVAAVGALGIVAIDRLAEGLSHGEPEAVARREAPAAFGAPRAVRRGPLAAARFGVMATTGASALFFGHIEAYTLPAVLMLWYMLAAISFLRGEGSLRTACILFTLSCVCHMEMLCMAPSLLWLFAVALRRETSDVRTLAALGLGCVVLPIGVVQWLCTLNPPPYPQFFGGGDGRMFVLLRAAGPATTHTLFSGPHVRDVLNLLGLAAPTALPILLLLAFARPRSLRDTTSLYACWSVATWCVFVFVWDPDLGAWRDWDLFMAIGFVLAFATAHVCSRALRPPYSWGLLIVIAVSQLARSLPFIADNALSYSP